MPTQTQPQSEPLDIAGIDKKLQKQFMFNGFFIALALIVIPIVLIPSQMTLAHKFPALFGWTQTGPKATTTPFNMYPASQTDLTHVYTSLPNIAMDILSAGVIMFVFWTGISRINAALIGYARDFASRRQWNDVVSVLTSFNQQGQHFLDRTGEAHYLIAQALSHTGKPQGAQKARDYVVKYRPKSEWAEKIIQQGGSKTGTHLHKTTAEATEAKPKPIKGKRRRF
ncbi:MAG TPA: hypothetical protein VGK19_12540 [Capsulimonadaceae bacterium]|jgi:hypothetical protein